MFDWFEKLRINRAIKRKDWPYLVSVKEFTPRVIAGYLGAKMPRSLESVQDKKASILSATIPLCQQDCIYFVNRTVSDAYHDTCVRKAFAAGAFCVVSRRPVKDGAGRELPCISVENPSEALIEVMSAFGGGGSAKIIALTGSIGKTSTKEMLHLVTAVKYKTVYSKNNQNGFGRVVRWKQSLPKNTEVFIQETGMSKPGSIDRAARVLRPDAFVVTNIGLNHVGSFGGKQENILAEKLNLDKYAKDGAVGFVNWDDPLLHAAAYHHPVITFAIDNQDADFHAENIVERNGKITFDAVEKNGERTPVLLNVVGRHNVSNALVALALGSWLGVPKAAAAKALEDFEPKGTRQNLVWLGGQHVYIDCYNASEGAIASVAATMDTIDVPEGAKRILVLGDIDDKLGERTEEIHRRVGANLAKAPGVDLLLAFGAHAAWAAEEAERGGLSALATEDRDQLEAWIREHMGQDDLIAFKGGQQMMLSRTIDNIFGTAFHMLDTDVTDRIGKFAFEGSREYCLMDGFGATLRKAKTESGSVVLPAEVDGCPLRIVGSNSFAKSGVTSVMVPEPARTIANKAFSRCASLSKVELPASLECIDARAFEGCEALAEIAVPEGVTTIGREAFSARGIKKVILPESVRTIGKNAFVDHADLTVVCAPGSYALEHMKANYTKVNIEEA